MDLFGNRIKGALYARRKDTGAVHARRGYLT